MRYVALIDIWDGSALIKAHHGEASVFESNEVYDAMTATPLADYHEPASQQQDEPTTLAELARMPAYPPVKTHLGGLNPGSMKQPLRGKGGRA